MSWRPGTHNWRYLVLEREKFSQIITDDIFSLFLYYLFYAPRVCTFWRLASTLNIKKAENLLYTCSINEDQHWIVLNRKSWCKKNYFQSRFLRYISYSFWYSTSYFHQSERRILGTFKGTVAWDGSLIMPSCPVYLSVREIWLRYA